MSHAITSSWPLRFKRVHVGEFEACSVNGTPADCVALGTHRWQHVDLVLSGINLGLNLGNSYWHSRHAGSSETGGTTWVAWHRFQHNVSDNREPDFSALEPYVAKMLDPLMPNKTLSW